jgi:hypothetical protein
MPFAGGPSVVRGDLRERERLGCSHRGRLSDLRPPGVILAVPFDEIEVHLSVVPLRGAVVPCKFTP